MVRYNSMAISEARCMRDQTSDRTCFKASSNQGASETGEPDSTTALQDVSGGSIRGFVEVGLSSFAGSHAYKMNPKKVCTHL